MEASVTETDMLVKAVSETRMSKTFLPLLVNVVSCGVSLALNSCKRLLMNMMRSATGIQSEVNRENCKIPVDSSSIGISALSVVLSVAFRLIL